jgi:hypothetical protein
MVSLGDFATNRAPGTEEALERISEPSEPDWSGTLTSGRAQGRGQQHPDPLTPEERRELGRRMQDEERRPARGRRPPPASDIGPWGGDLEGFPSDYIGYGSRGLSEAELRRAARGPGRDRRRESGDRGRFRYREADDLRASFAGGFNSGYGEPGSPGGGRMRGGFGGEGYGEFGETYGRRGAQAGGGGSYRAGQEDYGSAALGGERTYGYSGEENYDRGIQSNRNRTFDEGDDRGLPYGSAPVGERADQTGTDHRGRGPRNYRRSDDRIREDICDRLTDDPHIDASEIDVRVDAGEVTLNGTVMSRPVKRHVEDLAEEARGVRHVQNNLRVQQKAGVLMGAARTTGEPEAATPAAEQQNTPVVF